MHLQAEALHRLAQGLQERQRVVVVPVDRPRWRPRGATLRNCSTSYKKYRRRTREPWVLVTSLDATADRIVGIYGERMKVEEAFRDAKAHRFGWMFEDARCRMLEGGNDPESIRRDQLGSRRLEVLLLLAAIAMLAVHTLGAAAERRGLHRAYQANSVRRRRVLSLFFLGKLIVHDAHPPSFGRSALQAAQNALRTAIEQASQPSRSRLRAICGDP